MPSKSKAQQRFFGMVHAGVIDKPKGMKDKDVKKFAKTKHKGLPNKKTDETMDTITFKQFLVTEMYELEELQNDERFLSLPMPKQKAVMFKVKQNPDMWEDILDQYYGQMGGMSHGGMDDYGMGDDYGMSGSGDESGLEGGDVDEPDDSENQYNYKW